MAFVIGIIGIESSTGPSSLELCESVEMALRNLGFTDFHRKSVPSEAPEIQWAIHELSHECSALFTVGGTGFGPDEVTPEATLPLLDRQAMNLVELMRLELHKKTDLGYLTRAVAGILGHTLIVNLPGHPSAAAICVEALSGLLVRILGDLKPRDPQ